MSDSAKEPSVYPAVKAIAQKVEERRKRQIKEYRLAISILEPLPDYQIAVEIAASGLKDAVETALSEPELLAVSGYLYYEKYLPLDRACEDAEIQKLVESSQRDYQAFLVLKLLAIVSAETTVLPSLSMWKTSYLLGVAPVPRRPPGLEPFRYVHRDSMIISEINTLVSLGFTATRNKAKKGKCACDVVSDALTELRHGIGYDAVSAIWSRRKTLPKPDYVTEILVEIIRPIRLY